MIPHQVVADRCAHAVQRPAGKLGRIAMATRTGHREQHRRTGPTGFGQGKDSVNVMPTGQRFDHYF